MKLKFQTQAATVTYDVVNGFGKLMEMKHG